MINSNVETGENFILCGKKMKVDFKISLHVVDIYLVFILLCEILRNLLLEIRYCAVGYYNVLTLHLSVSLSVHLKNICIINICRHFPQSAFSPRGADKSYREADKSGLMFEFCKEHTPICSAPKGAVSILLISLLWDQNLDLKKGVYVHRPVIGTCRTETLSWSCR